MLQVPDQVARPRLRALHVGDGGQRDRRAGQGLGQVPRAVLGVQAAHRVGGRAARQGQEQEQGQGQAGAARPQEALRQAARVHKRHGRHSPPLPDGGPQLAQVSFRADNINARYTFTDQLINIAEKLYSY